MDKAVAAVITCIFDWLAAIEISLLHIKDISIFAVHQRPRRWGRGLYDTNRSAHPMEGLKIMFCYGAEGVAFHFLKVASYSGILLPFRSLSEKRIEQTSVTSKYM